MYNADLHAPARWRLRAVSIGTGCLIATGLSAGLASTANAATSVTAGEPKPAPMTKDEKAAADQALKEQKAAEDAEKKAADEEAKQAKALADQEAKDEKAKQDADKKAADEEAKQAKAIADQEAKDEKAKQDADKKAADQEAKEEKAKQDAAKKAADQAAKEAKKNPQPSDSGSTGSADSTPTTPAGSVGGPGTNPSTDNNGDSGNHGTDNNGDSGNHGTGNNGQGNGGVSQGNNGDSGNHGTGNNGQGNGGVGQGNSGDNGNHGQGNNGNGVGGVGGGNNGGNGNHGTGNNGDNGNHGQGNNGKGHQDEPVTSVVFGDVISGPTTGPENWLPFSAADNTTTTSVPLAALYLSAAGSLGNSALSGAETHVLGVKFTATPSVTEQLSANAMIKAFDKKAKARAPRVKAGGPSSFNGSALTSGTFHNAGNAVPLLALLLLVEILIIGRRMAAKVRRPGARAVSTGAVLTGPGQVRWA